MTTGARAVPFHCPYCGDEDLRPHGDKHGDWECHACQRAFKLTFTGILRRQYDPTTTTRRDSP